MVENTLVKEQLTSAMVDAGAELLKKLDEMGAAMNAALWLYDAELNEWRLVFASPEVSGKGPREVYRTIQQARDQLGDHVAAAPFSMITLVDAEAELVRLLKAAVSIRAGINRVRFSRNAIHGRFIEDALIYRVM